MCMHQLRIKVMIQFYNYIQFPKYHVKILLDFSAKVRRKDIFKPTIRNENSHEIIMMMMMIIIMRS